MTSDEPGPLECLRFRFCDFCRCLEFFRACKQTNKKTQTQNQTRKPKKHVLPFLCSYFYLSLGFYFILVCVHVHACSCGLEHVCGEGGGQPRGSFRCLRWGSLSLTSYTRLPWCLLSPSSYLAGGILRLFWGMPCPALYGVWGERRSLCLGGKFFTSRTVS